MRIVPIPASAVLKKMNVDKDLGESIETLTGWKGPLVQAASRTPRNDTVTIT
jgi:hypothetical protein